MSIEVGDEIFATPMEHSVFLEYIERFVFVHNGRAAMIHGNDLLLMHPSAQPLCCVRIVNDMHIEPVYRVMISGGEPAWITQRHLDGIRKKQLKLEVVL